MRLTHTLKSALESRAAYLHSDHPWATCSWPVLVRQNRRWLIISRCGLNFGLSLFVRAAAHANCRLP